MYERHFLMYRQGNIDNHKIMLIIKQKTECPESRQMRLDDIVYH